MSDSALRAFVARWTSGLAASSALRPSGDSVIRTTVPPSRGVSSSVTFAVPNGRPFARRRSSRGDSETSDSVLSRTVSGPTPIVW